MNYNAVDVLMGYGSGVWVWVWFQIWFGLGIMRVEFARREAASIIADFLVAMAVARRGKRNGGNKIYRFYTG